MRETDMRDWPFHPTAEDLAGLNKQREGYGLPAIETCSRASEWFAACDEIDMCANNLDPVLVKMAPGSGTTSRPTVIEQIQTERSRQDTKWGVQNHPPEWWLAILVEEVGELAQAVLETHFDNGPAAGHLRGPGCIKREAIQVAAVAQAMLECMERMEEKATSEGTQEPDLDFWGLKKTPERLE